MKKGDIVRVIDPMSAFQDLEGPIQEVRTPPLPLGVKFKGKRAPIWFCEQELEMVQEKK